LFFSFLTCCNINIHHIHICHNYLCVNNKLNFYYYHRFPMKHFMHLSKLWIIYHFMSIQTTYVAYIWKCLLWFLIMLWCLYGCHYGLLLFLSSWLHIIINHSIICAILVSLPCITLCFWWCCLFCTLWYWKCTPCFHSSHSFFTQHCHLLMLL
jgi:hypothetical protein